MQLTLSKELYKISMTLAVPMDLSHRPNDTHIAPKPQILHMTIHKATVPLTFLQDVSQSHNISHIPYGRFSVSQDLSHYSRTSYSATRSLTPLQVVSQCHKIYHIPPGSHVLYPTNCNININIVLHKSQSSCQRS